MISYEVTILSLLAVSPFAQDELQRYVLFARRFNPKVSEQLCSKLTAIEFLANRKRLLMWVEEPEALTMFVL